MYYDKNVFSNFGIHGDINIVLDTRKGTGIGFKITYITDEIIARNLYILLNII